MSALSKTIVYTSAMGHRFELSFDLTRDDWIAANEALHRLSPHWDAAAREYRKSATRQLLWVSPLIVVAAALFIGRGSATRGMYVEGAVVGVVFAGLMVWGIPRID